MVQLRLIPILACVTLACNLTAAPQTARTGRVRVSGHCLEDDHGPFLGLGVSYFTALWRCKNDRARLESDLAFLAEQGFNYYRMLSMVGYYGAWDGLEIAPIAFTSREGKEVKAWPDYWEQLRTLIDLAYDRFGMRTQITIFADAQLMPAKADRIAHMQHLLDHVIPGRDHKIILLEVANEAWQNGFPDKQGVADLREFTQYLAGRTDIPVAITSHHNDGFEGFDQIYGGTAADIATWHFSRDRRPDRGWQPVYDCWDYADRPGFPPVSSNEPIGPGSSVSTENEPIKLVTAAAFAYAAKLPMYVFHTGAGVFGKTRFEAMPAIDRFHNLIQILPADLPNWERHDAKGQQAPLLLFQDTNYRGEDRPPADSSEPGCVRLITATKGNRFVAIPIGIHPDGLHIQATSNLEFTAYHPVTGESTHTVSMKANEHKLLPGNPEALIILGRIQP
ncbi:MAG: hypothetical protein PHF14_02135 [Verrucomicrobiota bacterium]|nr:hypothetical protein [Verrucomicrobiota bacterium]